MKELTQARLKELLHYDPDTGEFTWVAQSRPGVRVGDVCGRTSVYGYREIGVEYRLHFAHRLAWLYMTGAWPTSEIDHENRCRSDNRWSNLRLANRVQNSANQGIRVSNSTGLHGVVWDKERGKWRAQIRIGGKKTNLGRFSTAEEAAAAHDRAALAEFGEFAHLNRHASNPDAEGVPPASST